MPIRWSRTKRTAYCYCCGAMHVGALVPRGKEEEYTPITPAEMRKQLTDVYTLESKLEAKEARRQKKMVKTAVVKKGDGTNWGDLKTFPAPDVPMNVILTPKIAGICTGSGFPYTADVRIVMVPNKLVLEYMSLDQELKLLVDKPMLGEEAAIWIFKMVWETIHPAYLSVGVCSHGIAHSPLGIHIEAHDLGSGEPAYTRGRIE